MLPVRKVSYYPIGLNIAAKECLVVGGGKVAQRKIERLLDYRANVQIVSPSLTPALQAWADTGLIKYRRVRFSPSVVKKQSLIFAATDDPALNRRIVRLAWRKGIFANAAKPGRASGFIVPALIRRPFFTVAVATEGRSPATAKKIKNRLERIL